MATSAASAPTMLCSDADTAAGDGIGGTSTTFKTFMLIEHAGGWSRTAAEDAVTAALPQDAALILGMDRLRPFAIRPVGRAETQHSVLSHVGRVGAEGFLSATSSVTVEQLQALDHHPGSVADPLFAVCTNGSRDRCCAVKGRPLAQHLHHSLADGDRSPVVEISHLGGHRFASTMIVLPWGYSYGRLSHEQALQVADAAAHGLVHPAGLRGRADLSPAAQAAEIRWRQEIGPADVAAVRITGESVGPESTEVVGTVDGQQRSLSMRLDPGVAIHETLCGGKPFTTGTWTAR